VPIHWTLPAIVVTSAVGALAMCLLVLKYGFSTAAGADVPPPPGQVPTRVGHALAGVAFAVAGMLAVVAMVRGPVPAAGQSEGLEGLARRLAALEDRLGGVQARLQRTESRADGAVAGVEGIEARLARAEGRVGGVAARLGDLTAGLRQVSADVEAAQADLRRLEERVAADRARLAAATRRSTDVARGAPSATRGRGTEAQPPASPKRPVSPPAEDPPKGESGTSARVQPEPDIPRTSAVPGGTDATDGPPAQRAERVTVDAGRAPRPEPEPGPRAAADERRAPEPGLGAKLRRDWETIKREGRATGEQIGSAFRRLRDWLSLD
jgi:hypothetical protein